MNTIKFTIALAACETTSMISFIALSALKARNTRAIRNNLKTDRLSAPEAPARVPIAEGIDATTRMKSNTSGPLVKYQTTPPSPAATANESHTLEVDEVISQRQGTNKRRGRELGKQHENRSWGLEFRWSQHTTSVQRKIDGVRAR